MELYVGMVVDPTVSPAGCSLPSTNSSCAASVHHCCESVTEVQGPSPPSTSYRVGLHIITSTCKNGLQ
ncbi:unnamed protein product [Urochloa humidicola]